MTTELIESNDGKPQWTMVRYTRTAAGCGQPSWVLPEHGVKCCPYCGSAQGGAQS